MKRSTVISALITLALILSRGALVAAEGLDDTALAAKIAKAPEGNIAFGKPYSFSQSPADTWNSHITKANQPLPDVTRVLTDGVVETDFSFWVSNKCVNFNRIDSVDVIVDLEDVYPIASISTRHSARPAAGGRLPWKEEYLVSEDGSHFVKVGEFVNPKDPLVVTGATDPKTLFEGILEYTSGPVKTRGRYVAIRTFTYPENQDDPAADRFLRYVGYDEVTVKAGDFKLAEVTLDPKKFVTLKPEFDASVFGYRISPPDFGKILRQTPLYIGLTPQHFLGDNEYHLSVGGTYVFTFQFYNKAAGPVKDLQFSCDIPSVLTVHDYNGQLKLDDPKPIDRDGVKYVRYRQSPPPDSSLDSHFWPFFVVSTAETKPTPNLGTVYYRYRYTVNGTKYTSPERSFQLVLRERITAPAPKKVLAGFWVPYYSRHFVNKDTTFERLFSFYKEVGFNTANGGQMNPAIHAALTKLDLEDFTGSGLSPNGLQLGLWQKDVKDRLSREIPFVHKPTSVYKDHYGVCPTKFLTEKYDGLRLEQAKRILAQTNHIYENWEPYLFMKRGCLCDDCKEAYRQFAKLSQEEVNAQWPQVVYDPKAKTFDEFNSQLYGRLVLALQKATTDAGREMGLKYHPAYILSINPVPYFKPGAMFFEAHNARDYFGGIDKLIIWKYDNVTSIIAPDPARLAGANLPIVSNFDDTTALVRKYGRKVDGGYLPKVYFLPTEHYEEMFALPAEYYFVSVLTFVHGMDGYGTWTMYFKADARYLEAHARANTLISAYEDVVRDGSVMAGCSATLVSPAPVTAGKTVNVTYARGFALQDKRVAALGNDHYLPTVVRLKVSEPLGDGTWQLVDRINHLVYCADAQTGFTAQQLAEGVLIDMPGKTWRMLELVRTGDQVPADAAQYVRRTPADITQALDALNK